MDRQKKGKGRKKETKERRMKGKKGRIEELKKGRKD